MKKLYTGLFALLISSTSSLAYAGPTELLIYSTNNKREIFNNLTFTIELYQEGNPSPLFQTSERKSTCQQGDNDSALICTTSGILDLPSKFAAVEGIGTYKVIFKPHDSRFPVQVSQDVVIDHDSASTARVIVEPFRVLQLYQRLFELGVQKRSFVPYPKSFTTYSIKESIVTAALAEAYLEMKDVRRVDEFEAFMALINLWKEYSAVTTNALLPVLANTVRFDNPENEEAAYQVLIDEGIDTPPTPDPF